MDSGSGAGMTKRWGVWILVWRCRNDGGGEKLANKKKPAVYPLAGRYKIAREEIHIYSYVGRFKY